MLRYYNYGSFLLRIPLRNNFENSVGIFWWCGRKFLLLKTGIVEDSTRASELKNVMYARIRIVAMKFKK